MRNSTERPSIFPYLALGAGLLVLGVLATNHIVNSFWPFDVARLDLVRATALDEANAASMLDAANGQILLAFLASVMVSVTGLAMPLVFYMNVRFDGSGQPITVLVVARQALWVGLWAAFCVWLQMNRSLGLAVVLLVALVLAAVETLFQVRRRASSLNV
jgi:hypothetical protein